MDDRLQDLRRRAARGEPGARAALLAERLRRGEFDLDRLRLAAFVGDADARALLGDPHAPPAADLVDLLVGLVDFGPEPVVQAAVAAAARDLARWSERPDLADDLTAVLLTADAVRRWLDCPCERHANEAGRVAVSARHAAFRAGIDRQRGGHWGPSAAAYFTAAAAWCAANPASMGKVIDAVLRGPRGTTISPYASDAIDVARTAVVAWALGERDALHERLEAARQP